MIIPDPLIYNKFILRLLLMQAIIFKYYNFSRDILLKLTGQANTLVG